MLASTILCRYAAVGSKVVQTKADKSAIEEDAEKLANYVCINYFIQDDSTGSVTYCLTYQDIVLDNLYRHGAVSSQFSGDEPGPKILPDSEYPSWLFELDLRPACPLEDLDPEKDGWLYWRALRIRQIEQNRRIQKLKTRFLHLQSSPSMKKFRRF
ncbi:unnamed protein product [Angiostrongylus costaricensis]|uniref:Large ribosomal subunit protein mL54 n=1 Tax=Angiostrongylus costaricensis TaxID=334426 RepID=A0A0R3PVI0_ANGCS|nr:unnamed protein product [Angiostrongylus costaricensis]